MMATEPDQEYVCGICGSAFTTLGALQRHWGQKKGHKGFIHMRSKRRRVEQFDQRIDTSAHTPISSEPQALPAHHNDHSPILLPAIPRKPSDNIEDFDTVVLDVGRYNPGSDLTKSSKNLLPIIAKLNKDDGEVLVKELYDARLIPWSNLNRANEFLDSHTVIFKLNKLLLKQMILCLCT
jgi:hypothetical protein